MHKLLIICGPTATGKTNLAAYLADKFDGELVSVDSRQVYTHMDIGTGKDRPEEVTVWGYDLADPKEEFSVSRYVEITQKIITDIHARGKLPIMVGGTGLYIKGIVDGIATINVPRDLKLRSKIENYSVGDLQKILQEVDAIKLESMNTSDRQNPRRLIRAIEVAGAEVEKKEGLFFDALFVGLKLAPDERDRRISLRVDARMKAGVLEEINNLLQMGVKWDNQSMSSLGYKQLAKYYDKTQSLSEAVDSWKKAEMKYARKQRTWFKKDRRIHWFDVSKETYVEKIENLVQKWYSSSTDAQKN